MQKETNECASEHERENAFVREGCIQVFKILQYEHFSFQKIKLLVL